MLCKDLKDSVRYNQATASHSSGAVSMNLWTSRSHALDYLARADQILHRTEGEAVLLDQVPTTVQRILDLGTGDGRLLALLKLDRPHARSVAVDFSTTMLEAVQRRFAEDDTVEIVSHNLDDPLPDLGIFDAIVSSFAIHHLSHDRKQILYGEIFKAIAPGGIFCNLEHVASPTPELHEKFLNAIGYSTETEDPSNQLLDVETQLHWLRNLGFEQVDCYWKWLEMALLVGIKPL
jgi:tRNA (cmo5U34)-methyltransferase